MSTRRQFLVKQARRTIRHPSRVLDVFNPDRRRKLQRKLARLAPATEAPDFADGPMSRRQYGTYDEYVAHQRSKLAVHDLTDYDRTFRAVLRDRLTELPVDWAGVPVLCLAARIGTEVKAFHDVGAFAVGIDLEPGADNRYVLPGDFHAIQFPDRSVGAVYTNSLDHAFDLAKVAAEVARVVRSGGFAVLEVVNGDDEGAEPGRWEALRWSHASDVVKPFLEVGFTVKHEQPFTDPWPGVGYLLTAP